MPGRNEEPSTSKLRITTGNHNRTGRATQLVAAALLLAGVMVAAYTVWTLWSTALSAEHAQNELRRRWTATVGATSTVPASVTPLLTDDPTIDTTAADGTTTSGDGPTGDDGKVPRRLPRRAVPDANDAPHVTAGDPYAVLWFSRSDGSNSPVHDAPLVVVQGVGTDELRTGPGHYPHSDVPGGDGNFAVAGHRTTYGAPFGRLDELLVGDFAHVADHNGRHWTYEVVKQRIVDPDDTWVLTADPLDIRIGTMTLTTCHPRWSARQRLVVFAELTNTPHE